MNPPNLRIATLVLHHFLHTMQTGWKLIANQADAAN